MDNITPNTQNVKAALWYAEKLSWHVLPCKPRAKTPCTKHGYKDATIDPVTILQLWKQNPTANIGIACGASGLTVIDIDIKAGENGEDSLEELEKELGKLPDTVEQITGSGGRQIFFRAVKGAKNHVKLREGIDIRAEGGYVIVPPSTHPNGKQYQWELSSRPDEVEIAELPEPWKKFLTNTKGGKRENAPKNKNLGLEGVEHGERDFALFQYACSLRAKGTTREEARLLLMEKARRCKPDATHKVEKCLQSAWKYPTSYSLDDTGNAQRLLDRFGSDIRYHCSWGKWLIWDGKRMRLDDTLRIADLAMQTVSMIKQEAEYTEDENFKAKIKNWAKQSRSRAKRDNMIAMAKGFQTIQVRTEDLNQHPWLLNLKNGTIDLRKGQLREHRRESLITNLAPVIYPSTKAGIPLWKAYLETTFLCDEELIRYVQKIAGMALTGDISEQLLMILYGTGRNGKGVFIDTMRAILGDYAVEVSADLIMKKKQQQHPTELADLYGKRLAVCDETDNYIRLSEGLVKKLTGGNRIKARRLYEDFWEFDPTHKLWIVTNHKPVIRGTDLAIWDRIKLIPFKAYIPPDKRRKYLRDELRKELSGILRWAVEGCLAWQKEGLNEPKCVREATKEYRAEQDIIGAFLEDRCITKQSELATASKLYKAYCEWCSENGERQVSQRIFGQQLAERGFSRERKRDGIVWHGIKVKILTI